VSRVARDLRWQTQTTRDNKLTAEIGDSSPLHGLGAALAHAVARDSPSPPSLASTRWPGQGGRRTVSTAKQLDETRLARSLPDVVRPQVDPIKDPLGAAREVA